VPLGRQHAHHLAGELLHPDGLADRIVLLPEQVVCDRPSQDTDLGGVIDVFLRERRPALDGPASDREVFRGDTSHLGGPILVPIHDGGPRIDIG